jgi:DNA-directed RNA polymerase specialized sigma24 family protein
LFRSRAIDWLRQRRRMPLLSLDDVPFEGSSLIREDPDSTVDERELEQGSVSLILLHHAKEATDAVRSRVDPETWRAYWIVAIEDQPVREVADALGKSYTAVYNGCKRVDRMLRQEGQRRLAAITSEAPTSFSTDRS